MPSAGEKLRSTFGMLKNPSDTLELLNSQCKKSGAKGSILLQLERLALVPSLVGFISKHLKP